MGLIILTLLGLKYLPGWVKLVWLFQDALALEKQVNALCAMNEGKPANAWLDGEDVCRRLHISPRRLQTLRNSRRLNYAQIGRKFYYKAKDIEDLLLSCKEETHKQEKI